MGLPLFIAPVESDLISKAADKSATAPPRSSIRRTRTTGRVTDRAERRRILRHFESLRQSGLIHGPGDDQSTSWETGFPPDNDLTTRPLRDVLRDMNASDERRRDHVENRLHSLFRDGSTSSVNHAGAPTLRDEIAVTSFPNDEIPARRYPPFLLQPSIHGPPSNAEEYRAMVRANLASQNQTRLPPPSATQRNRNFDGLGDRERSLSPEVWDTLLSTLTPDPQPPSAGSSFASIMASQSAGATSGTSFTAPDPAQDTAIDQACESGCEGSETEEPDRSQAILNRIRRRREEMRRGVRPELNSPFDNWFGRDSGAVSSDSRHQRSPDGPVVGRLRRARSIRDHTNHNGYNRARQAWVGHLSVGNSDDEQGPERTRRNRENPATSGSNTHSREEDWMSMQRIVHSMARREDIPDEWWAGAGLSRTLPGDGTE
ncbi:hypothetical protein FVEN_g5775 [Fusarium venenatum]|uniref:Uncharacterized protein n=1 Tax=Fusarium venenatum TaxID=56646 RepID=A0A2L2T8W6_9HYPO|nr:uncharacterized protein FVRRES_03836 [Fusarium venenatum]KAG8356375.1 hypothetical protein FVEN_g5775 [Fusarium venenatum]KAH7003173.1 hypothetical protein EDB82DRAFT_519221 [Fusarium venenatum]CEI67324.1 unnamed protein product [Fusarium venenatum]